MTQRYTAHSSLKFRANVPSPPFTHFKRGGAVGAVAYIKPLRINTVIWNHQHGPKDACASICHEREAGLRSAR